MTARPDLPAMPQCHECATHFYKYRPFIGVIWNLVVVSYSFLKIDDWWNAMLLPASKQQRQ
jgi:hypothetical protein